MPKAYVPLSLNFFEDDRVIELSPLAQLIFIASLIVAKRMESDGLVTAAQVRRQCPNVPEFDVLTAELVDQKLWVPQGDGRHQLIPAWLGWNRSKAWLDENRVKRAESGRLGGQRSAEVRNVKQSAADEPSTLLPSDEPKRREVKRRENPPTPLADSLAAVRAALPSGNGVVATQKGGGVNRDQALRVTERLVRLCTARNRERVNVEAVALVTWATRALDLREVESAVKLAEDAPTRPSLPRFLAKTLQRRARDARVPLPDFVPPKSRERTAS